MIADSFQLCGCIPSFQSMCALPTRRLCSLVAEAPTAPHPSCCERVTASAGRCTICIVEWTYTGKMLDSTNQRDGRAVNSSKRLALVLAMWTFMAVQDYASAVSGHCLSNHLQTNAIRSEDYALQEASVAAIRILQRYPNIRLPPSEPNEPVGAEKQNLTITLSSAEGTKVLLDQHILISFRYGSIDSNLQNSVLEYACVIRH